ncbi:MAG: hypothetical protein IJO33_01810 [Bacilli bacterium]|nr:hypothetical protein [Bacilli bacterium]
MRRFFKTIFIFILLIIFYPVITFADVYYVTKEDANMRSTAQVVDGNIIMSIKRGAVVELLSESKTWGGSCNSGWYNISYAGSIGYVCSGYIAYGNPENETDEFLRPWTTPKKAIIGGAKYIASSYINRGQSTSYLKKFNVTSNSTYNHQYMANLAAPYSEAYNSYKSYRDNGLLELPLEFSIPIFTNMPDYTKLPGKDADTSCQIEITDEAFETELNNQGFPESYKCKLRLLHAKYPNWKFVAFHTNLDFNRSVRAEQAVSSINGGSIYYATPVEETESGWYIANTETVEYYLDPRNFLNEERILMFEDLSYRDYYTESAISTILKGTFMEEYSLLDNQTYSTIFVEAGNTAKMSSVYLASLARQESGSNGSKATSGNEFTYQGTTYKGLYNFYNIGANSSAESPILAGLVWATGGFDVDYVTNNNSSSSSNNDSLDKNTSSGLSEQDILNKMGVKKSSDCLTGIELGKTVGELKQKLSGLTISTSLGDGDKVRTGMILTVSDGTTSYKYTLAIAGDVDGDGEMMATDYVKIKNYIMEVKDSSLNVAQSLAADVDNNGSIGATDYVLIKNSIMSR